MSLKLFAILFLVFVVGSFARSKSERDYRKCVPGKHFNDGCNYCSCSKEGYMSCTMMACLQYDEETNSYIPNKSSPAPDDFWA
ncbi:hypothetical protein WN48_06739 [Eufriesea mexicana]|uniref:Pacifastin domain-containing protein n=1 Tax=Eufriesea mexicana TaxID=516756 RepID=A0A310SP66_9HYME|nr:PREDICTED: serine protease inhibitor 3-like [Eufriesea mexicana]OAD59974.1 hypothetical protein WN48_06739 [Eufriesea mexicana]